MAKRTDLEEEDASELMLGAEFQDEKCLMISEVAIVLSKYDAILKEDGAEQSNNVFDKCLEYCKRFNKFENPQAVTHVRELLSTAGFYEFEPEGRAGTFRRRSRCYAGYHEYFQGYPVVITEGDTCKCSWTCHRHCRRDSEAREKFKTAWKDCRLARCFNAVKFIRNEVVRQDLSANPHDEKMVFKHSAQDDGYGDPLYCITES
ncbi:hypothetical protein CYMTET_4916 [Cymbomonas tetramitiformis]|uniref:Uncharacterized protein n=1 Tax=Cymbomonas tetramitiformis TaxID=36881 RepID=A0AAE0LJF6_9CHLO|nr:hypothetical protein CYMTET_4916 [Cymbomonas tetramitiformis]